MPENITNNRIGRDLQRFFINSTEIPGIQSVKVDYALTNAPFVYAGMKAPQGVQNLPKGVSLGSVNLSSFLISDDLLLPLTGSAPVNCYILRSRNNSQNMVVAQSGVLTNYSASYKLNQLPQINASFAVYGAVGTYSDAIVQSDLQTIQNGYSNAVLKTAGPGCVSISLNNFQTNRVLGYDLSLNCPRNGIYELGQTLLPKAIFSSNPIEVNCSFEIEIDSYNLSNPRASYVPGAANLTLAIKDFFSNDPITTYSFSNLFLNSEVYNTSVDNNTTVQASYKGFICR